MGVAFLLLFPVLYTDVTDAWRLRKRRQRLLVDASGILAELTVAGLALFLWAFLPEGPTKSAAFFLATTSWVLSLAINLNPFMKFDGYYLASDISGVNNLQNRSFDLALWKMREILFGLGDPPPEHFPRRLARGLVIYAWATWIYRAILFIGIALLVYAWFFKLLGIILFLVEIAWFIVLPVKREVGIWWERRSEIMASRRGLITTGIAGLVLLGLAVP